MSITEQGLGEYLKQVVDPNILSQISKGAMEEGLKGMANILNQPQPQQTRGAGHSR
ncbi:MAG: hypothetical protein AABY33_03255 [Pseudomonadota bacterium]